MKKTLIILAAVITSILMLSCIAVHAEEAPQGTKCGQTAYYTIKDGIVTFTGSGKIDGQTFMLRHDITEAYIEEGITELGNDTFYYCNNLKYISLPKSLTTLDSGAISNMRNHFVLEFRGAFPEDIAKDAFWCANLTVRLSEPCDESLMKGYGASAIKYVGGLQHCGDDAIYTFTSDDSLVIKGTGEIKANAFKGHTDIAKVTIEDGITGIGDSAFDTCSNLKEVSLPSTLKTLGSRAFAGTSLTTVSIPASVESIGSGLFSNVKALTSAKLAEGLKVLGKSMFADCNNLKTANIPNSITVIPQDAFSFCDLSSITIPESVTEIGENAFYTNNTTKTVVIPGNVKKIGKYAFGRCYALTSVTIKDGVEILGPSCFDQCKALTSVTIPDSVTSYGDYCFASCTSLKSIKLPGNIKKIPDAMFANCRALESIKIPDGVTSIGFGAFDSCTSLTEITFPSSVTDIGKHVCAYSTGLKKVTCLSETMPKCGKDLFFECSELKNVYVSAYISGDYANDSSWNKFNIVGIFPADKLTPDASGVYHIKTARDFGILLHTIADGNTYSGKKIVLDNDIDLSSILVTTVWPDSKQENGFKGHFDGSSHTVSNIKIDHSAHRTALFRTADDGACIENLVLDNVNINGHDMDCCAALIAYAKGKVTVNNITVKSGSILSGSYVGGIVGRMRGNKALTITNCVNHASITASKSDAAGILGYSSTSAGVTIDKCENTAAISSASGHTGGIAGYLGNKDDDPDHTVQNCKNSGEVTSNGNAGGIIGGVQSDGIGHIIFQNENTANVTASGTGSYAGGIIGYHKGGGFIAYNKNSGNIVSTGREAGGITAAVEDDSTEFDSNENYGDVTAKLRAGGILGYAGNNDHDKAYQFTNCKNSGAITSETSDAGGIVGGLCTDNKSHSVAGNVNTGKITGVKSVGGIIGWMEGGGSITHNINSGNVTATGDSGKAGGITGQVEDDRCDFSNSTSTGEITGTKSASVCGYDGYQKKSVGTPGVMTSSVFSAGSPIMIVFCSGALIIAAAMLLIFRKPKENK